MYNSNLGLIPDIEHFKLQQRLQFLLQFRGLPFDTGRQINYELKLSWPQNQNTVEGTKKVSKSTQDPLTELSRVKKVFSQSMK